MGETDDPGSPLESAAGGAGQQATDAFTLLSNETRLAILLALWEADDPHATEQAVTFSDLRERVGMRDSGQFNYHLSQLTDQFVRQTPDGYVLRPVGLELVQTVIAGTGSEAALEPTELDIPCHLCGAPTAVTYQSGWLYHVCTACEGGFSLGGRDHPEGILFMEPFSPAGLADRTPEEVFAAGVFRLLAVMMMKAGGVCPRCSGVVASSISVCDDHEPADDGPCPTCGESREVVVRWVCRVCKYRGSASPSAVAALHPASVAFHHAHGIDIGYPVNDVEAATRVLSILREADVAVASTDPLRLTVTVTCGDDTLELTLDETLALVDAEGPASARTD